jgi:hypothetical protein
MDDLGALHYQQQLEQREQEETDFFSFNTQHPVYDDFNIIVQRKEDGEILIQAGVPGCRSWHVLTREDARKLGHYLIYLTKK